MNCAKMLKTDWRTRRATRDLNGHGPAGFAIFGPRLHECKYLRALPEPSRRPPPTIHLGKADAKYLGRAGPRTWRRVAHRNNRVEVGGSCAPAILARRGQSNAWAGGVKHAGS
jgi:hypothetical protein